MRIFLLAIVLSFSIHMNAAAAAGDASATALSPEQVVTLFSDTYGTARMDEIGPYTTARFRDDRPVSAWVVEEWEYLYDLGYEKIDFEIIETKVDPGSGRASVAARATIRSEEIVTEQEEVYTLILEGKTWKLDDFFVTDKVTEQENPEL